MDWVFREVIYAESLKTHLASALFPQGLIWRTLCTTRMILTIL